MLYSWVQAVRRGVVLSLLALAFAAGSALAQAGRIEGTVRSATTGEPLANARVTVLGRNLSAITDARGFYQISDLPPGGYDVRATLLGFAPVTLTNVRVGPGLAATANVEMRAAAIQLEEVVVTALGIEREQRTLSFAAQMISEDKLTDVPKANMVASLQGNIAGVHVTNSGSPFGSARVVVRGASSILGQNQPLFIVDGVPIDNSAASLDGYGGGSMAGYDIGNAAGEINANNIESMTVLKGPNAAALYGSRAANGAIVITTKKGQGAPGEGGFGVTATFGTTFQRPLRLPDYQNQYGQGFYGEFDFVVIAPFGEAQADFLAGTDQGAGRLQKQAPVPDALRHVAPMRDALVILRFVDVRLVIDRRVHDLGRIGDRRLELHRMELAPRRAGRERPRALGDALEMNDQRVARRNRPALRGNDFERCADIEDLAALDQSEAIVVEAAELHALPEGRIR